MRVFSVLMLSCWIGACAAAPAQGPREPVKLGEPSDDIDPQVIGTAVRANAGRFQRCYEAARESNPSLQGLVEVRFLINCDGSVGQAMVADTDLPSPVTDCVLGVFYDLKLPEQKEPVIAQYPMFFNPG